MMGHGLRGFYVVRFNALKVKIIFCDFGKTIESSVTEVRTKRLASKKNETASPKNITRVCKGIGSQPCSCYYPNFPEVLQFELSNDEITRRAIHENGTVPSTCEDLKKIGHMLNGFYFLRLNTRTIKTSYCTLDVTDQEAKNKNSSNTSFQIKLTSPGKFTTIINSNS